MIMTTIRVKKDARYFSASNEPFNDKRLSWEARGLMGYLLSKPNNWQIRIADLEKQGPAGNHKIRRMLAELRQYGYMNRIRITNDNKTFDWMTDVYESPSQNPKPSTQIQKASGGKSTSGSSTRGKPHNIVKTDGASTDSDIDSEIFKALEELTGGLNTNTPRFVDTWKEKHPVERIMEAIALAKTTGRKPVQYVDSILVGWEANGYPKTREQRVQDARKNGNGSKPQGPAPAINEDEIARTRRLIAERDAHPKGKPPSVRPAIKQLAQQKGIPQ
jgi:hypothetical protein